MTDNPHQFAVTNDMFNKYLEAKAPEKPCPECDSNMWMSTVSPGADPADESSPLAVGFLVAADKNKGFPVMTLHCNNCGFVKMFAASNVIDWLKKNG